MDAIETEDPAQVANNGDESPDSTSSASEGSIPGGSSNNVFSSSRPRDIGDGMSKGLGNVFKGVLGGVAMMVASPVAGGIQGAKEGGIAGGIYGAGMGLGMGIVGGTATALYGVGSGIAQISRGVINTPAAAIAISEGCDWDDEKKEWIMYDLKAHSEIVMAHDEDSYIKLLEADCQREHDAEEEHRKALKKKHQKQMQEKKEQEAKKANPNNPTTSNQSGYSEATSSQTKPKAKTVKAKAKAKKAAAASVDTEYYQLLGVSSGASASQIKKGYYKAAKESHPDRHGDDPEASAKFQKIGEAYGILSDEKKRSTYDKYGKDGLKDESKQADPMAIFAMLFGSENFEPLFGELSIASQMRLGLAAESEGKGEKDKEETETGANSEIDLEEGDADEEEVPFVLEDYTGYGSTYHTKLSTFIQQQRQIKCALNLANKLQPFLDSFGQYTDGNAEGFKAMCEQEAKDLASSPIGAILLNLIGNAYVEWVRSENDALDYAAVTMKQVTRNMYTKASIGYSGAKSFANLALPSFSSMFSSSSTSDPPSAAGGAHSSADAQTADAAEAAAQKTQKEQEEDSTGMSPDRSRRMEAASKSMQVILWRVTELDIRSTLSKICRKVTHDHSVDELARKQRLRALAILGNAFLDHGQPLDSVDNISLLLQGSAFGQAAGMGQPKAKATQAVEEEK